MLEMTTMKITLRYAVQLTVMAVAFTLIWGCNEVAKTERVVEPVDQISVDAVQNSYRVDFAKPVESDQEIALMIEKTGRYQVSITGEGEGEVWLEDYIDNKDDRTYDITGKMSPAMRPSVEGSPMAKGEHKMRLHVADGVKVKSLSIKLMKEIDSTPTVLTQSIEGEEWSLVWSDEFDGSGLPDTTKWTYRFGDWGWGNNELQYYVADNTANSRVEDGNLIIEAIQDSETGKWSSARLSTQGKTSFTYGKIEYRARVPTGRGTWAAGWLLGNAYKDELSWPYCGEIDVLECVGYEIDNETGDGINHGTCHTRAYYFKQGNQIGGEIKLKSMDSEFHVYAIEWYKDRILGFVDGQHYFTYDKNTNKLEWPFNNPHNIIINLAIGGGWGGLKGVDESMTSQRYILDYVRVYEKK